MNRFDFVKGAVLTVGLAVASNADAQKVKQLDLELDNNKELKFDASTIKSYDDFMIKDDNVVKEELQAKKIVVQKGVLTNPYAASFNMENGASMEFYGSDEGLLAARYIAPNGAACAVNAEMDKDLIAKLDAASNENNDAELMKLSKEMAKVQDKFGKDDKQVVRESLEGYGIDDSRNKSGVSFQTRVNLNLKDSKENGATYNLWALKVAKSQNKR